MNRSRFRLGTPAMVAGLVTIMLLLSVPVWAQLVEPPRPIWQDPVAMLGWLKLNMIGVGFVISLLWKHLPIVKDWSNMALPWVTLVSFVLMQVGGVPEAHAGGLFGTIGSGARWATAGLLAIANSAVSKALWDGWIKHSVGDWLDRKLGRVPQTP